MSAEPRTLSNFVGGVFVAPHSAAYIESENPSTATIVCRVPDSDARDVQDATHAAKSAFKQWSTMTNAARSKLLNRVADLIEERLEEFAAAESADQGKPVSLARAVDIPRACANFRFFAGAILHHEERSTEIDGQCLNYTVRRPVGVAGLISPWNLPLYLLTWKIAPAIAVGNTCVCKPSEFTSLTAYLLCEVIQKAGVPAGVVNMVFGDGPKVGAEIAGHPDIPLISFTGSTLTGEKIAHLAARHHKKVSLELGGKNATLVFADADLHKVIPGAVRAAFANQGEICLCGSRIFVQRPLYEAFIERFVEETRKQVVGDPTDPATTMGALVSRQHFDKVQSYIALAREEGGKLLLDGSNVRSTLPAHLQSGYFIGPTVVAGLGPAARCCREEIFGPVVTIGVFDTTEEAVSIANSVDYGLAASVWTENLGCAHRVAQALDAGTIWVNCWMVRDLRVPFGGMKHSGVGREGGELSIDFYTEIKTICVYLH